MIEIKNKDTGKIMITVPSDTLRNTDLSGEDLLLAALLDAVLGGANLSEADLSEAFSQLGSRK